MGTEPKVWYKAKLPPPTHVWQLDTDLEAAYEGMEDIGTGPRYLSHVRKGEYWAEYGGPKTNYMSFFDAYRVVDGDDIVDGRIELIGPDIPEQEPEATYPLAMTIRIWGSELKEEQTDYALRGILMGVMWTEGWMFTGTKDTIWIRVSKAIAPKMSFKILGQAIRASVLTMCSIVEACEVRFVVATPEMGGADLIDEMLKETRPKWEAIEAKAREMVDEDVDMFYGCTLCRMIAPNHACIITPSIVPYCGMVTYAACKSIYEMDPQGYIFEAPRGEVLDSTMGWYKGIDDAIWEKSGHRHKHFHLHSIIKYSTTN